MVTGFAVCCNQHLAKLPQPQLHANSCSLVRLVVCKAVPCNALRPRVGGTVQHARVRRCIMAEWCTDAVAGAAGHAESRGRVVRARRVTEAGDMCRHPIQRAVEWDTIG